MEKQLDDRPHEECGVFGVFGSSKASLLTTMGLFALQHRGQEATGIVAHSPDSEFAVWHGLGLVSDNYTSNVVDELVGTSAIGHVRYSTSGKKSKNDRRNIQPLFLDEEMIDGGLALAHNGNLTNAVELRRKLIAEEGRIFHASADTAVIMHLAARSRETNIVDRLIDGLRQVQGSYSLVALTKDCMIGARDPFGVRPLVLGQTKDGAWVLASETCALDVISARFVRKVERGEVIVISDQGIVSLSPFVPKPSRFCVFEYIYFAHPGSVWDCRTNCLIRREIGRQLARECPVKADIVMAVPDSGVDGAIGYARESGILYDPGLMRSHYIGRSFINPEQVTREEMIRLKFNAVRAVVEGKSVAVVDDSVVRGTTSIKVVHMLREAGAWEVHLLSTSPQYSFPCFLGIDTPEQSKLLAAQFEGDLAKMAAYLGVDSLGYISLPGLYEAIAMVSGHPDGLSCCDACFSGDYPKYD